MVASYTSNGRITKQGTDDNPNTWGTVMNNQVIELFEEAVMDVIDIDITGSSNVTLTTANGSTDQARHATLELTGTLGANIELRLPAIDKQYFIRGAWSGAYTVTVKISGSSTSVAMSTGDKKIVYINGTDIFDMTEEQGIRVSSDDTTSGLLEDKLSSNNSIELTTTNPGSNEVRSISVNPNLLLTGLGLSGQSFKPGSVTDDDVDFQVGGYASLNGVYMEIPSIIVKGIDGSWAAGTNQGGLDTGVVAADSTYYLFVIHNTSSNTTDALFSLSRTAPSMPTGYTEKRLIGFVITNSFSNISEWHVIWTSFGPFSTPLMYLIAKVSSANAIQSCYFVFNTNPADTGERVVFTSVGGIQADDDLQAFTT
jgi:hypothetical protein